jgi:hypothetical protein
VHIAELIRLYAARYGVRVVVGAHRGVEKVHEVMIAPHETARPLQSSTAGALFRVSPAPAPDGGTSGTTYISSEHLMTPNRLLAFLEQNDPDFAAVTKSQSLSLQARTGAPDYYWTEPPPAQDATAAEPATPDASEPEKKNVMDAPEPAPETPADAYLQQIRALEGDVRNRPATIKKFVWTYTPHAPCKRARGDQGVWCAHCKVLRAQTPKPA